MYEWTMKVIFLRFERYGCVERISYDMTFIFTFKYNIFELEIFATRVYKMDCREKSILKVKKKLQIENEERIF